MLQHFMTFAFWVYSNLCSLRHFLEGSRSSTTYRVSQKKVSIKIHLYFPLKFPFTWISFCLLTCLLKIRERCHVLFIHIFLKTCFDHCGFWSNHKLGRLFSGTPCASIEMHIAHRLRHRNHHGQHPK